jgi:hypothetical protein
MFVAIREGGRGAVVTSPEHFQGPEKKVEAKVVFLEVAGDSWRWRWRWIRVGRGRVGEGAYRLISRLDLPQVH